MYRFLSRLKTHTHIPSPYISPLRPDLIQHAHLFCGIISNVKLTYFYGDFNSFKLFIRRTDTFLSDLRTSPVIQRPTHTRQTERWIGRRSDVWTDNYTI